MSNERADKSGFQRLINDREDAYIQPRGPETVRPGRRPNAEKERYAQEHGGEVMQHSKFPTTIDLKFDANG